MVEKVNDFINLFRNTEVYSTLSKYYLDAPINDNEYNLFIKEIKTIVVNHYFNKYKFTTYIDNSTYSKFLSSLIGVVSISKRIKVKDDFFKVFPVKASDNELKSVYYNFLGQMVDYQFETCMNIDRIFEMYSNDLKGEIDKFKKNLLERKMVPYYGSSIYIMKRVRFIKECIDLIPDVDVDITPIIEEMSNFERKYESYKSDISYLCDYESVPDEFYADFNRFEECYKKILHIENQLCPIVLKYWEEYLTDPKKHDETDYRYVMHTFSSEMVDPKLMKKACCALNTSELVVTPYGSSGLIFALDSESLETICCEDVGSWVCDFKTYVGRECPTSWQMIKTDGLNVWYEFEENCKLIMPQQVEKACLEANIRRYGDILRDERSICYSEIYLNNKAKAIGVFYTDECKNIEEVREYALKYNLPLVNISRKRQRELRGMADISGKRKL